MTLVEAYSSVGRRVIFQASGVLTAPDLGIIERVSPAGVTVRWEYEEGTKLEKPEDLTIYNPEW